MEYFTSFEEISNKYPINDIVDMQLNNCSRQIYREATNDYYYTHDKEVKITRCIKYEYDGKFWYPKFKTEYIVQYEEC